MLQFIEDKLRQETANVEAIYKCIDMITENLKSNYELPDEALTYNAEKDVYLIALDKEKTQHCAISHNAQTLVIEFVKTDFAKRSETLMGVLNASFSEQKINETDILTVTNSDDYFRMKDVFFNISLMISRVINPNLNKNETETIPSEDVEIVDEEK